ncbi:MAG: ABC transporter ATP-binding protein [Anaerorhabdus sp.]
MKKLMKYAKPYWIPIILIVVFVYGQVQAELALPEYMSNIVSEGIQYGGVESGLPSAMTETTYHRVYLLSSDENKQQLETLYQHIEINSAEYSEEYPLNKKEAIYVLEGEAEATFELEIAKALLAIQGLSDPALTEDMQLPEGVDIWMVLELQPEQAAVIIEKVNEQFASYSDDNLESAAKVAIKSEYTALEMDTDKIQSDYIFKEGFVMLGIALIAAFFAIVGAYLASQVAGKIARDMRRDVFKKVESFSSAEFGKFSASSLITRTTNDVQQVQQVLTMVFRIVLFAPLMGVGALLKVWQYPSMLWVLGIVVVLLLLLLVGTFLIALPKFKIVQNLIDRINLVMKEYLEGMLVIRAFNTQGHEEKKFDKANLDITKVNLFINRVMSSLMPIMGFLMNISTLLVVWVGSQQVDLGLMQIGEMMAFIQYATQILMSFFMVSVISIMLPRSAVSIKRIAEVLDTEPTIVDKEQTKEMPKEIQDIVFDKVSFKYPKAEEYVLKDISFTAKVGETVAFIGSTGSGKSTLINLLPRFFDVSSGTITYGGVNIQDFSQHDLREQIGYVPQKGVLFSGDIESNLRYADEDASDEMIQQAIEVSQSKEFVEAKPEKIKTPIAQGGTNVSGGQKQRLSIARAITKDPNIYIFDDSFSALDYKTDAKLRAALKKFTEKSKKTVFIVAQRISTIVQADKILVLEQGVIVGEGTHEELLQTCSVYQEIAQSQLTKEGQ